LVYPGEPIPGYPFDGEQMWSCQGRFTRQPTPDVIGKEGNMTGGSSGGPWLIPGHDYINGVASYSNIDFPDEDYSPYFDRDVLKLYEKAFQSGLARPIRRRVRRNRPR